MLGFKPQPKCFDLLKSGQNTCKSGQKCHPTLFDFKQWCPTFAEKHMNPVFGDHTQKRVLNGRKFIGESHTKLSASLGDFGQQSFARPKIFLLLHLCPGIGQKYVCRKGQKWQNFIFTTRNNEHNFFCKKFDGKMSNLKIFWGLALPSDAHASETFYNN